MSGSESEKRNYTRHRIWFPVTLDSAEGRVLGICRDVGLGGLFLSATTTVGPGVSLIAHFRVSAAGISYSVPATIVRCEQNEEEMVQTFPYRLALVFDTPLTSLEEQLQNA